MLTQIAVAEARLEALQHRERDAIARAERAEAQLAEAHGAMLSQSRMAKG